MAKKKKEEEEEEEEEEEAFESDPIESVYPSIKKADSVDQEESVSAKDKSTEEFEEEVGEEFEEEEEEIKKPTYKYLDLSIIRYPGENNYELTIEGQSHGFCNLLVKHLLTIEGVKSAAYKTTGIEPSKVFIQLDGDHDVKSILQKSIEALREELVEVEELFQEIM